MQGEQDGSPPNDALYQANLDTLLTKLKQSIRPVNADLPIIVGQMRGSDEGNTGGLFEVIRNAQKDIVKYEEDENRAVSTTSFLHDRSYLIYTLDYATFDGIHWIADDVIQFGFSCFSAYQFLQQN